MTSPSSCIPAQKRGVTGAPYTTNMEFLGSFYSTFDMAS